MKEFFKKPGEDLPIEFYGVQIAVVKDAPTIPIHSNKLTYSIDANGLHFPGVDGSNPVIIDNDFATDSPEFPLLFLGADKGKVNLVANIMHATLDTDPRWNFETTQKHWASVMTQATGLKNIPAPVKGSTRKLVKPSDGNIDSTVFEQSLGADVIITKAHQASVDKPLVIFMGGQTPTVASAYLKDKSIADKIILFHINGYWDGGTDGYNTADPWATYILIKRMKYVCVNVKFPDGGKYWYTGKNVGLTQTLIDSIPDSVATRMLEKWYADAYTRESMADSPAVLWFFNNKLWKNAVRKREDGTISTGNDYDFIFITEHDWTQYGPTLVDKMKEFIGNVITPPVGGISSGFEEAIRTAAPGKTVVFNKGDYILPRIAVNPGVSIDFGGSIIRPNPGTEERGMFEFKSSVKTAGNQSIKNGTIEANNFYAAVIADNRDNLEVSLNVRQTRFTSVWINNSVGSKVVNGSFHNGGWSSTGYLSGAINIKSVTDFLIEGNTFTSDGADQGTAIEALWKFPDNPNVLRNVKILRNTFKLDHRNPWNNNTLKNFSIELHNTDYRGLEIAYNNIGNEMSLASHRRGDGTKTLIHDNFGNLGGDTYFIESVADDFEVYNNIIENCSMFMANFQANTKWRNWNIYNNELKNPSGALSWGGVILIGSLGVENVRLENNRFPKDRPLIKYMGVSGGITQVGINQV